MMVGLMVGVWTDNLVNTAYAQDLAAPKIAFASDRDGNTEIYIMKADGSDISRLSHDGENAFPAWSPDGEKIVFLHGFSEIYVMKADGSDQTKLTSGWDELPTTLSTDGFTSWSPDGKQIVFTSFRDGNAEIYVMNADGSDQTRLTNNPAGAILPSWSPDGTTIMYNAERDGNPEIYVMNADGSGQTRLTINAGRAEDVDFSLGRPMWSPDGKQIVFETLRDGNSEIYVADADGRGMVNLTNHPASDYAPVWSPAPATISPVTAVLEAHQGAVPPAFGLDQNHPNPFNSSTAIRFYLPQSEAVELAVYNLAGQQVATLANGPRLAGAYTVRWDGRNEADRELASGPYLYRLLVGEQTETRKLLLLR